MRAKDSHRAVVPGRDTRTRRRSRLDRRCAAFKGIARRRMADGPGSRGEKRVLRLRLQRALQRQGRKKRVAEETAFHMTDWLWDLHDLYDLYTGHSRWASKRVESIVMRFLGHVPNHVAAAAKILMDAPVRDIFEVGAVEGSTVKSRRRRSRHATRKRR